MEDGGVVYILRRTCVCVCVREMYTVFVDALVRRVCSEIVAVLPATHTKACSGDCR